MNYKLLLIVMLLLLGCSKPTELVRLVISDNSNALYYSFTYKGGAYDPQDSTVVVTDKYKFTLPTNEPTGYIQPNGYKPRAGAIKIESAINSLIKLSY